MPQPKLCNAARCPFYAMDGRKYCEDHQDIEARVRASRNRRHSFSKRSTSNYQARQRFYNSTRWRMLRLQILARDGHQCTWPDCTETDDLVVDHIGGFDPTDLADALNEERLRTLCRRHSGHADGGRAHNKRPLLNNTNDE